MANIVPPRVVYHVAGMGHWKEVVNHQLRLLRECGLHQEVRITYLGDELQWLKDRCVVHGVTATVVRHDPNFNHYETFALMEVERLAKEVSHDPRPILYFHTKGVSAPGHQQKTDWRVAMEEHVIRRWRENLLHLEEGEGYDAIGVSWWPHGEQHFSGNFWIAKPAWIRRLPNFGEYHQRKGLQRFSCEMWVGAAEWCRAYSLGCQEQILSWYPTGKLIPEQYPKTRTLPVTVCVPTIPPRTAQLRRALESISRQTANVGMVMHVDADRRGSDHTRNTALGKVETKWTAFLDDDDELYADHCETLHDFAIHSGADVVYPGCVVLDRNETPIPLNEMWGRFGQEFDPQLLRRQSYIPVTSLVRTELAKKAGFHRVPGTDYDDWGFYLRLLDMGAKIIHLPVVTWKWHHWGYGTRGNPGNTSGMPDRWE